MDLYGRVALVLLAAPISAPAQVVVVPSFSGGLYGGPPVVGYPVPLAWGGYPAYGFAGLSPIVMPPVVIGGQPPAGPAVNAPPGRGTAMPGQVAGRFRPVSRADRERARRPVRPEPPPPVPPDPKSEHDALVLDGRRAFAAGEYGRAAELFRRADTDFLLAQALLALGKYPDAVAAIHRGMARQPNWPLSGPALRDLYGLHPDRLSEHRRQLDEAAAADPADAALAFLRAYVRWFDGQRDEARDLFRTLRDRVARPEVIDRFLAG